MTFYTKEEYEAANPDDLWLADMIWDIGTFGTYHYFIKSNGIIIRFQTGSPTYSNNLIEREPDEDGGVFRDFRNAKVKDKKIIFNPYIDFNPDLDRVLSRP